jgi:hypothetical protein
MQAAEAASARLSVDRPGQAHTGEARGSTTEWSNYSGNKAGSKYSPLAASNSSSSRPGAPTCLRNLSRCA